MDDRASYLHQRDPSVDRRFRPKPQTKFNLANALLENDEFESNESSSSGSTVTEKNEACVYLRLRPTSSSSNIYKVDRDTLIVQNIENGATTGTKEPKELAEKHYTFSNIFTHATSQREIYNNCVGPYIEAEDNLTILTYGTSGSGKTYTMHGDEREIGIIRRAIEHIFCHYGNEVADAPGLKLNRGDISFVDQINKKVEESLRKKYTENFSHDEYEQACDQIRAEHNFYVENDVRSPRRTVVIWVSFAEIYNEKVFDLLQIETSKYPGIPKRTNLKVICNEGNAFIKDLTTVHVRNAQEAFAVLSNGLRQVQFAATNVNRNSSRSHCIFIMNLLVIDDQELDVITYKFCDLAGSERLKKTNNEGERLKEAQGINTSLMVLGRCLDATYQNQNQLKLGVKQTIPFRESKLTMLLQAPLQGKEKIVTVVNMCPTRDFLEENMNVLAFSAMAKQIVHIAPKPTRRSSLYRKARSTRFSWIMTDKVRSPQLDVSIELNYLTRLNME